jgi:hypothetical protein
VKDLSGAFAQLPHLPKMLKASAILDTLADGCEKGTFVLRLTRPDGSFRTWWMSRPDENGLKDPALELILAEAAELGELLPGLLAPGKLPALWGTDLSQGQEGGITAEAMAEYFRGSTVVHVERDGYQEPVPIPKAGQEVVDKAISGAVEDGTLWLLSGPASILGEPIPPGVLNAQSILSAPPGPIAPAEILPENLPGAWKEGLASALSIATSLSMKVGKTLPWKSIREVIGGALQARFLELGEGSQAWPCDFPSARFVLLRLPKSAPPPPPPPPRGVLVAEADLEPSQIQDLGDIVPQLLEIKAKANVPIRFRVRVEMGDGKALPSAGAVKEANAVLKSVRTDLELK